MNKAKFFILLGTFMLAVTHLNALTVKTKDGRTYPDAKVFDTKVNGIVINYMNDNGFDCLTFINFKELSEKLRKKYKYNKTAAGKFDTEHHNWIAAQKKKEEKGKKLSDEMLKLQNEIDMLVEKRAIDIQFQGGDTLQQGTEGKCWRIFPNGKQVYKGKILLYGQELGDTGSSWAGGVYPLNKTVVNKGENLECYAGIDIAKQLLLKKAKQKLLNEKKQ
ncbi:MAG: hypothetical protein K9M56_00410 [Victivallales bacterium]|nr:hypothetical protein [Victivallales bacterium]